MFRLNRPIFLISSKSLFSKYVSSCMICKDLSYENWLPGIMVKVCWADWLLEKMFCFYFYQNLAPWIRQPEKQFKQPRKKSFLINTKSIFHTSYSLVTSLNKTGHFVHWIDSNTLFSSSFKGWGIWMYWEDGYFLSDASGKGSFTNYVYNTR